MTRTIKITDVSLIALVATLRAMFFSIEVTWIDGWEFVPGLFNTVTRSTTTEKIVVQFCKFRVLEIYPHGAVMRYRVRPPVCLGAEAIANIHGDLRAAQASRAA